MEKPLHKKARTDAAIRRAIQNSDESLARLAARYDINPKTAAKWRKRTTVEDSPMGPRHLHSTVLTTEEEAVVTAFRLHTLLPLDDCFRALKRIVPQLTRTSLHRCFKRHGINRLSDISNERQMVEKEVNEKEVNEKEMNENGSKEKIDRFPARSLSRRVHQDQIGRFQLDVIEICTKEKTLYLFVGLDRAAKLAYAEFHPEQTKEKINEYVRRLNLAAAANQKQSNGSAGGMKWLDRLKGRSRAG